MGEKLDEGLLLDLIEKRRAGKFTGDELLYAVDNIEVVRWAMGHPKVVAVLKRGLRTGRLSFVETPHFFTPILFKDLPEELRGIEIRWRRLASELGYAGSVAWKVKAGFTLKQDAPKAGPCHENFAHLGRNYRLQNDEPTKDSIVFWIPRLLPGSTAKTVDEQRSLLADLRTRYDLPSTHLASFGSAALLAGLIFAHFKITGERVPLDRYWVRTDTLIAVGGDWLGLGGFGECGLDCDDGWDDDRCCALGCFALGMEALG